MPITLKQAFDTLKPLLATIEGYVLEAQQESIMEVVCVLLRAKGFSTVVEPVLLHGPNTGLFEDRDRTIFCVGQSHILMDAWGNIERSAIIQAHCERLGWSVERARPWSYKTYAPVLGWNEGRREEVIRWKSWFDHYDLNDHVPLQRASKASPRL